MDILSLIIVLVVIGFVGRLVLAGIAIKKGVDYLRNFNQAIAEQQQLLQKVKNGAASPDQVKDQFLAAALQAANQMQQMNQLRRQQSQDAMGQMLSNAAGAGIYINPSSLGL